MEHVKIYFIIFGAIELKLWLQNARRTLNLLLRGGDRRYQLVSRPHFRFFKRKQKIPQAHGSRCSFHPGVF